MQRKHNIRKVGIEALEVTTYVICNGNKSIYKSRDTDLMQSLNKTLKAVGHILWRWDGAF